jgi:hypothetical protein
VTRGWCLKPIANQIQTCTNDSNCTAGTCDTDLGYCSIDPYFACRTDRDCSPEQYCSRERGFCLERVFETQQCNPSLPCTAGTCDEEVGWCMPDREDQQCRHDDECPFGDCLGSGACDQQTFVFPKDFRPAVDCLRQD